MDPHAQPPARGEVAAKPSVARAPYYSRRPGWRNWSDAIGLNPIVLRGVWVRVPPRAPSADTARRGGCQRGISTSLRLERLEGGRATIKGAMDADLAIRLQPRARREEVV